MVRIGFYVALLGSLAACVSQPNEARLSELAADRNKQIVAQSITPSEFNPTSVNQISDAENTAAAVQIGSTAQAPQLTVDQLMAYADRCAPTQFQTPTDIDCSELSLRMRRVFQTEDRIANALITLDRLGRADRFDTVDDELGRNSGQLSLSAQAIASDVLTTDPAPLPEQPIVTDGLEEFLNGIGLGVNAGAIVTQPSGG